jgi:hypothetical protein
MRGVTLLLSAFVLAGCAGTPAPATPSATPAPTVTEQEDPRGSRTNPFPFGEPVVIEVEGETDGPAWEVTVDQPRDMSAEILAAAVEAYGDEDESYLASSRPEPGTTFAGFTGTVERLIDTPAQPGADLDTAVIGSDGQTYDSLTLFVSPPEDYLSDISEMYRPATAAFSNIQVVPEGTTVQQVLVIATFTGARYYFGEPVTGEPTAVPEQAAPADPEAAFIEKLAVDVPTLAEPVANNPAAVFLDWGRHQCQLLEEQGSQALFDSLVGAMNAGGEAADRLQAYQEEVGVTATAVATLCPEQTLVWEEFVRQAEELGTSLGG